MGSTHEIRGVSCGGVLQMLAYVGLAVLATATLIVVVTALGR
ncbi:hypothetical protein [Arthrobacter oryzae]|nr:hypothetical protein [Arthrobacter oryzae]MDQ0078515.1 hypothetical protein [Arthrobacter oryzae]